jgi:diacylglycerol kinase (ATP)
MKRAILVHNAKAGQGKYTLEALIEMLAKAGFRARHRDAKNKQHLKSLRKLRGGLVVVAGGDGTVGKVSRRVAGNGVAIAVLPLGTANNIARSLGIAGEVPELIAGLKRARRTKIDVGIAMGPWGERVFLEGIGVGLFADVMAALDSGRSRRRKRPVNGENEKIQFAPDDKHLEAPLQALAEALPHAKARATHVSIDGKAISGKFLLVEAMNMPFFGPNLHLTPDADPGDGQFDIVLLGEDHREEFQGYLQHRLEGGKDAPDVTAIQGKRLSFEWGGAKLHIDDKSVAMHDDDRADGESNVVKVKIERAALEFLVPAPKSAKAQPRRRGALPAKPKRGKNRVSFRS